MSSESITIENSVYLWKIPLFLVFVFFSSSFAFIGSNLLFVAILTELPEIYTILVPSFTAAYAITAFFRNHIIKKIFLRMTPTKFLEFTYILKKIMMIATGSMYLMIILSFIVPMEIYDTPQIGLPIFSFIFLYFPIYVFGNAITDSGEIRIAFESLFSNLHNFKQRQKWMKKIFRKLEKKLKLGNMEVSSDKLIYYCNLKLMNSEDIQNNLRDIERWMLGEQIENIANTIKQIIPEKEIKPIEKISLLDRFFQIPSDVRKYLFLAIIILIIVVLKPELVERIISEIM